MLEIIGYIVCPILFFGMLITCIISIVRIDEYFEDRKPK